MQKEKVHVFPDHNMCNAWRNSPTSITLKVESGLVFDHSMSMLTDKDGFRYKRDGKTTMDDSPTLYYIYRKV